MWFGRRSHMFVWFDFIDYIYTKGDIGPEGIEFIPEDAYGNSLIVISLCIKTIKLNRIL